MVSESAILYERDTMARSEPYHLQVEEAFRITPNMLRIVFAGEDLADFPEGMESGYMKLLFPNLDASSKKKNLVRTFTIRKFDTVTNRLSMDFALHDHTDGPASAWAKQTSNGDKLQMRGPGPVKLVDFSADWFYLVGDMTSLPAIACNFEKMPASARGHAVIQVNSEADCQKLEVPDGIEVEWVINDKPHIQNDKLVEAVKSKVLPKGTPSIWVACEFSNMRALRAYFMEVCKIEKQNIYISSYWKINANEDQHRKHKSKDAKQQMSIAQRILLAFGFVIRRLGF